MIGIYYDNLHIYWTTKLNWIKPLTYELDQTLGNYPLKKRKKHKKISLNKRQQIHKMYLIDYDKKKKIRVKNTYLHDCR